MNTDTFKLIENVFKKETKGEIEDHLNDEIKKIVNYLNGYGYKVDENGFKETYQVILHKDNTILEKLHLHELIYIRNGINGNWDIESIGDTKETKQYYKRLESVFQGLYDTSFN